MNGQQRQGFGSVGLGPAEALAGALEELYPDTIDIAIVDILTEYASFPLKNSVRDYKYLAAHPWLCLPPGWRVKPFAWGPDDGL